ncbi:MAG: transposase [Cocleimonas sp.]|nr:transposase [Cocleimonas sp.]
MRWDGKPSCPYCNSVKYRVLKEGRYQCNECYTSYSATVDTIFHKTRVDLEKWHVVILLVVSNNIISNVKLSKQINVNKNTTCRMVNIIKNAYLNKDKLLMKILERYHGRLG